MSEQGQPAAPRSSRPKGVLWGFPIFLAFALLSWKQESNTKRLFDQGAVVRGDTARRELSLVFTGHEFADGGSHIREVLKKTGVKAGFFFTGDFYRDPRFAELITALVKDGHYLGPHSDKHLLYCSWEDREKLLVTKKQFVTDILVNYEVMSRFGIEKREPLLFIPPYEWFNETIAAWSKELGLTLFNFTPGTRSNADYTTPDMRAYVTSEEIYRSILEYEKRSARGLNGFILLIHIGTDPARKDKFYLRLGDLIDSLLRQGYSFRRIDELLAEGPKVSRAANKR